MSTGQTTEEFRSELRAWLESNCPEEMRDGGMAEDAICWGGRNWKFTSDAQEQWLKRCAEQ